MTCRSGWPFQRRLFGPRLTCSSSVCSTTDGDAPFVRHRHRRKSLLRLSLEQPGAQTTRRAVVWTLFSWTKSRDWASSCHWTEHTLFKRYLAIASWLFFNYYFIHFIVILFITHWFFYVIVLLLFCSVSMKPTLGRSDNFAFMFGALW